MAPSDISEPVLRLISDHIESIERLEILLLLFDSKNRPWSIAEIEAQIRSTQDSIAQNVNGLVTVGMIAPINVHPERYQYAVTDLARDQVVAALAEAYRKRRVAVIEQIYAERHDPLRNFSAAFRLGKSHDR